MRESYPECDNKAMEQIVKTVKTKVEHHPANMEDITAKVVKSPVPDIKETPVAHPLSLSDIVYMAAIVIASEVIIAIISFSFLMYMINAYL